MFFKNALLATAVMCGAAAALGAVVPVGPGDFLPGSTLVDFETGSTATPDIPGIHFVSTGNPSSPPWFGGQCSFSSAFFGSQLYANTVSVSLSELAIEFSPPLHATGAWIGHIPNLINQHADPVLFRILDTVDGVISEWQLDLPDVGQPPIFVGARSDTPIARVEWRGGDTGIFALDNLMAGDATPEPASLLLICVAVAFTTRRR